MERGYEKLAFLTNISLSFIHSFIHSLIAICRANHVENVESEAQALEARWSVIGKVVSF